MSTGPGRERDMLYSSGAVKRRTEKFRKNGKDTLSKLIRVHHLTLLSLLKPTKVNQDLMIEIISDIPTSPPAESGADAPSTVYTYDSAL